MAQYFQVKAKYPDAIMLFRVGDFYETFGEDAIKTSAALGITLTRRNNGGSDIELAGFPYHALDVYLPRLVRAGYRVAICEQMEKPVPGKVVRRAVTEMVTPGLTTDDSLLEHNQNNYLCAIAWGPGERFGLAFIDISTGEFFGAEADRHTADKLLQSLKPAEILAPKSRLKEFYALFGDKIFASTLEDWIFTYEFSRDKLLKHFQTQSLKGFGLEDFPIAQTAAGAALHYLATTEHHRLAHINSLSRLQTDQYVWLDRFSIRNLELIAPNHEHGVPLLQVLDVTQSPMGARLMKKWTLLPLLNAHHIAERHEAVDFFIQNPEIAGEALEKIKLIGDLERLMSKVAVSKITPREFQQLGRALDALAQIKHALAQNPAARAVPLLQRLADGINPCPTLRERLESVIHAEAPNDIRKGGVIADGVHPELDALRRLTANSREVLLEIQQREIAATGIPNLKIGFNNVFGYYLEVNNKHKHLAPDEWIRKQTIANGERYITQELKDLESRILGAEEKMLEIEARVYADLIEDAAAYIQPVQHSAHMIAQADCLIAFARNAERYGYCRPVIDESLIVDIREGRHPVIERQLSPGDAYVPNDVYLDSDTVQVMMITGPNMAGKSALLRQTALIVLMAQMGSFVPAKSARIGLIDKVFTRVGASDNISAGESTFMVEMNETALIMNNISDRSLILLDEIGRGTSTYDGISIAWSLAEYLHGNGRCRPKTLFATHYHELNELADKHERIHNFHISTREAGQKVIFLRKLSPGGSNHSFGIHVARMAGMPAEIIERARDILSQLEAKHIGELEPDATPAEKMRKKARNIQPAMQLQIFDSLDPYTLRIQEELLKLELNTMTPIDAIWKLQELQKAVIEAQKRR